MTPDERTLLQSFLDDLANANSQTKDAQADGMIGDALRRNPDAAYLLVQHAMLSDQALHAAQAQIGELQRQLSAQTAAPPSTSFLSGASGPWGQAPAQGAPPQYVGGGPFSQQSGLGSFLRQAGTTAAGVAAGDMLFSGLEGIFGGNRYGGW